MWEGGEGVRDMIGAVLLLCASCRLILIIPVCLYARASYWNTERVIGYSEM